MSRAASRFHIAFAIVVCAAFALPLYIAIISVFKPSNLIISDPFTPTGLTFDNLARVVSGEQGNTWRLITNSLIITSASLAVVVLAAAMLAFFLNRAPRVFTRMILPLLLIGLMLPAQVFLVPLVRVLRSFELMGTLPGLFLFNVGYYLPFGVLLFVGSLKTIPHEIDEAAQLDGASTLRIFFSVYLPLMRPAVTSVVIIVGVWIWNDFLNPLIILGPGLGTTATVGIYRSIGQYQSDFGIVFALSFVAMAPVIIMFLALQKYFVKGLVSGGIKG